LEEWDVRHDRVQANGGCTGGRRRKSRGKEREGPGKMTPINSGATEGLKLP